MTTEEELYTSTDDVLAEEELDKRADEIFAFLSHEMGPDNIENLRTNAGKGVLATVLAVVFSAIAGHPNPQEQVNDIQAGMFALAKLSTGQPEGESE